MNLYIYSIPFSPCQGLTRSDLDSLPVGVALPIWDSILHCQEQAPPSWPLAAYDIIGELIKGVQMEWFFLMQFPHMTGRDDIVKTMREDCSISALCMEVWHMHLSANLPSQLCIHNMHTEGGDPGIIDNYDYLCVTVFLLMLPVSRER